VGGVDPAGAPTDRLPIGGGSAQRFCKNRLSKAKCLIPPPVLRVPIQGSDPAKLNVTDWQKSHKKCVCACRYV